MLDANLKTQLKGYLERVKLPFEIVASLDDSAGAIEMHGLLQDSVSLTDKSRCGPMAPTRVARRSR